MPPRRRAQATSSSDSDASTSGDEGAVFLPTGRHGLRRRPSGGVASPEGPPAPAGVAADTPLAASIAAARSPRAPFAPDTPPTRCLPVGLLRAREGGGGRFSAAQRAFLASSPFSPAAPTALIDRLPSRAYVGHFSTSGALFVAGFQADRRVRLYDTRAAATATRWPLVKSVEARGLRWTITEVAVSDDDTALAYSTISPDVRVLPLGRGSARHSVTNVTEVHAPVALDRVDGGHPDARLPPFGVWSLKWQPGTAASARRLLAGTGGGGGDGHVVVADVERGLTISRGLAASDDVNAVAFLDGSGHLFASGGDDADVKVWDARTLPRGGDDVAAARARPVATLRGHLGGVTYLDARGDGVHVLSNAKDQTAKLWDIRAPARRTTRPAPRVDFDYRWMAWPRAAAGLAHPADTALATFRGHAVLVTLVRARLSPPAAGGAHVYAGSADGCVRVWDVATGEITRTLDHHADVVRDVSWSPSAPGVLATASFDGSIVRWGPTGEGEGARVGREHTGNEREVWF